MFLIWEKVVCHVCLSQQGFEPGLNQLGLTSNRLAESQLHSLSFNKLCLYVQRISQKYKEYYPENELKIKV